MRLTNKLTTARNPFVLIFLIPLLSACTGFSSSPPTDEITNASATTDVQRVVSIQKTQGINVGESNSIWGVGIIKASDADLKLNVERISLKPGENFKKQIWTIPVTGNLALSGTGSRTFLSQWGLLIGRGSNSTGDVGMFIVDSDQNKWSLIFTASDACAGARNTVFAYQVRGSDNRDYEFIAMAYARKTATAGVCSLQVERFLVDPTVSDLALRFKRVMPYNGISTKLTSNAAVYSGFLYPNCSTNGCKPMLYANYVPQLQGIDLTADVPATAYNATAAPLAAVFVDPPNAAFVSTSHPKSDAGPFGSINYAAYSMAGDPSDGYAYLTHDPSSLINCSFVAYDRVNEIVFRVGKSCKVGVEGAAENLTAIPTIVAFKRQCFFDPAFTNCSPKDTAHSRVYTDVGIDLGPSSDLGNGCIAIMGLKRPGESGSANYDSPVYTACIRDPRNLDKGLAVTKIGSVKGATYMYNDFTGASLVDRPVQILFDFHERRLNGMKKARFYWAPKVGFAETMSGVNVRYRCFSKDRASNPPPFRNFGAFPKAMTPTDIPDCGGPGITQVEFEFTRVPKQRFTRFDMLNVTAIRE